MAPECVSDNSFLKFSRDGGGGGWVHAPRPPSYGCASQTHMTRSPPNLLHTPFCPPLPKCLDETLVLELLWGDKLLAYNYMKVCGGYTEN